MIKSTTPVLTSVVRAPRSPLVMCVSYFTELYMKKKHAVEAWLSHIQYGYHIYTCYGDGLCRRNGSESMFVTPEIIESISLIDNY